MEWERDFEHCSIGVYSLYQIQDDVKEMVNDLFFAHWTFDIAVRKEVHLGGVTTTLLQVGLGTCSGDVYICIWLC